MVIRIKGKKMDLYLTIYNQIKHGKNPATISKDLKISKQKINYYIRQLKDKGLIKKIGYGVWEVRKEVKNTPKHTSIRGHAFIWKVKHNITEWIKILQRNKIPYKLVGRDKYPRIIIKNRKIWLGKNIVIYENKSFYADNPVNSRKYAVIGLKEVLEALEKKLMINLKPYRFKPSREHYGMIKNDLAIQCNRNNEKIHVRDEAEGEWLWIDDSMQLGELETGGTKALVRGTQVQKWWNDNKKHNFQVTPTFLMERMNQVTENQMMFAKNIEYHFNVLDSIKEAVKELKNEVRRLNDRNN